MSKSKPIFVPGLRAIAILMAAFGSLNAHAETSAQALDEITSTADKLCGNVATSGHFDTTKVTGDIQAELRGLAKRLADLGITGTADITSTTYEGVLQQELTTALKDVRECKLTVFKTLQEKLLPNQRSDKIQGLLIPGRDPSPANACTQQAGAVMSPDAVVMYYGTNTLITDLFPFTVAHISERDLFVINRDKDKNISVNLEILGTDGRNIMKSSIIFLP